MDLTLNTFIGIITAVSGIVIALITNWVSRKKDSDGVLSNREKQISDEMWLIIGQLKDDAKLDDERKLHLQMQVTDLEKQLRESRLREITLMAENSELLGKVRQ